MGDTQSGVINSKITIMEDEEVSKVQELELVPDNQEEVVNHVINFNDHELYYLSIDDVRFVNCLDGDLTLEDNLVMKCNPEFGKLLVCNAPRTTVGKMGNIELSGINYQINRKVYKLLDDFVRENPNTLLVVSPMLATVLNKIFEGKCIAVSPMNTEETNDSDPKDKVVLARRWNVSIF